VKTKFEVDPDGCTGCGGCAALCPVSAIEVDAIRAMITNDCIGCGICADFCPVSVIDRRKT